MHYFLPSTLGYHTAYLCTVMHHAYNRAHNHAYNHVHSGLGRANEASVLMSGLSGEVASQVTRRLTAKGVTHERMLFCDYF